MPFLGSHLLKTAEKEEVQYLRSTDVAHTDVTLQCHTASPAHTMATATGHRATHGHRLLQHRDIHLRGKKASHNHEEPHQHLQFGVK